MKAMLRYSIRAACLAALCACGGAEVDLPEACAAGESLVYEAGAWSCGPVAAAPEVNGLAQASLPCAAGEIVVFDGVDWACDVPASAAGGDITAVTTSEGSGLVGGAEQGAVSLAVRFAGSGAADSAARSDHGHAFDTLEGLPEGFADRVDGDALAELACETGQVPSFDESTAAWGCRTLGSGTGGVEVDPTVNDLARAAALDACGAGEVPIVSGGQWQCGLPATFDTLTGLSCGDGQAAVWSAMVGAWLCGDVGGAGVQAMTAGPGVVLGGTAADVTVAVDFGGACASGAAACREHAHPELVQDLASVLGAGASANGLRVADLAPPLFAADAATKAYVDAQSAGGGGSLAFALCCGAACPVGLPGWNCDDVGSAGRISFPLPDDRGFLSVPNSGAPGYFGPQGAQVTLEACAGEWFVCSQVGVTQVILSCGGFASSPMPGPWSCGAPGRSYFFAPGATGPIFVDGTDGANQMLTRTATAYQPPALIDCSGASPLPNGARTAVCWR